ncbi:MAG: hypothetical protein RL748_198 [Pseudomonadota bacterium]
MTSLEQLLHKNIEKAIHPDWHFTPVNADGGDAMVDGQVRRKRTVWHITEPESEHNLLIVHARDSIAFSLDQNGKKPFPFLGGTLAGLHTVADCILVTEHNGGDYVFIIEMKNKPGHGARPQAIKQIHASARLMDWLCKTLNALKHWEGTAVFIGVISYKPREQPRKGLSVRETPVPVQEGDVPIFELKNHPILDVPLLLTEWVAMGDAGDNVEGSSSMVRFSL